jgi:hypothetical protein
VEAGGQLKAAHQQVLRVFVAAQAHGDLGQHADRGDVGRRALEVFAQQCLRFRNPVFAQRGGCGQQLRVAGGVAHVVGIGQVRAFGIVHRHQMVAEGQPGLRKVGLERHCTAQCRRRRIALVRPAQGDAEFQVGHRRIRLRGGQRLQDPQRAFEVAARAPGNAEHQQRHRMLADCLDDFRRLFAGHRRIGRQQSRSVRERRVQIGGRRGGIHAE